MGIKKKKSTYFPKKLLNNLTTLSSHKEPKHCTLNKHDINKSFKKKQSPRPSFNFSTAKLFSFLHNMQFITSFHKVLKGTSAKDKKDSCFFSSLFVFKFSETTLSYLSFSFFYSFALFLFFLFKPWTYSFLCLFLSITFIV